MLSRRLLLLILPAILLHMTNMTCSMLVAGLLLLAPRIRTSRVPGFPILGPFSSLHLLFVGADRCPLRRLGRESRHIVHILNHYVRG